MSATLLVVEDSPVIGALVRKIVTRHEASVTFVNATDGKEGFRLLKEHRPRVVVLDWMMPRFDGRYFLEQQRADPDVADIPVVIHSAMNQGDIREQLEGFASVRDYLQKPIVPSRLYEKIRIYLGDSSAIREFE